MNTRPILVTGVAGFVGSMLAMRLLANGHDVVGLDNLNSYYDVSLKHARLAEVRKVATEQGRGFTFHELDLMEQPRVLALMQATAPAYVVHLAAQAGVRYGMENQQVYLESNLIGHFSMLAGLKALADAGTPVTHFLYASSSSVYGDQKKTPFSETDPVNRPLSLYASTKKANEMVMFAWANQFKIPATGLRFFTVYGPWGRPDMSPMLFAAAILDGRPIPLFNGGDLWRDFTYVDDIVEAIVRLLPLPPTPEEGEGVAHRVLNLGNQNPVRLDTYVQTMAKVLGRDAQIDPKPWPPTEVYQTFADTSALKALTGWQPATALEEGLARFAAWYAPWHGKIKV